MILAIDVHYNDNTAVVAGVSFENWKDCTAKEVYTSKITNIEAYESGKFYKRELPCILSLLNEHNLTPEIIIVDGYVYLDGKEEAGLGKYLYDKLNNGTIIIGVAKAPYKSISQEYALSRGKSKKALYITAKGLTLEDAKIAILSMCGKYRFPELLKKVDKLCRNNC